MRFNGLKSHLRLQKLRFLDAPGLFLLEIVLTGAYDLADVLANVLVLKWMIGALMGQGKRDEAEAKKAEVAALKEKSVKLSAEMKQTADAQASRGARVTGGPLGGVRMLGSVAIPLFTGVFRHAETLSAAMDARCYHGEQGRTRLHALTFGRGDALAAVVTALLLICVIVINLQLV